MKAAMIGLGRLGLPVAVAMAKYHDIMGYDINPHRMSYKPQAYREVGLEYEDFNDDLAASGIAFGQLEEVVAHADIIFVAVQTPHEPQFEGITPLPDERADFNYSYLQQAVRDVVDAAGDEEKILVVISTVLPGTMNKYIVGMLPDNIKPVYNPFFIAMGTVMQDFMNPEFILLGGTDDRALNTVRHLYKLMISGVPEYAIMSIESAELTKVAYNTFISMKLSFANTMLEIAAKSPGVDVDEVMAGIKMGTDRLISTKYLDPGMGDGGGCHPRDNIALSWLARELDLSYDFFEAVMLSRQGRAKWLADMMNQYDLPKCILGYTFKKETNITTGSHALLVAEYLKDAHIYDPHVETWQEFPFREDKMVFLIGMNHPEFTEYQFAPGSIIIDPWRYMPDIEGCTVIRLGERHES